VKLFFITERASLLIPSGADHNPSQKHLFVALTEPWVYQKKERAILVNFTSVMQSRQFDQSCILTPEDNAHPFIKRPSYINYAGARIEEAAAIRRGVNSGQLIQQGAICAKAFKRIVAGLNNSNHTTFAIKAAHRDYLSKR